MSGRGRGMNNAPAWMTRGGGGDRGPADHDAFGRLSRDPTDMRSPPLMDHHRGPPPPRNNGRGPPPPRGGGGGPPYGGGGDRYDDRGPGGGGRYDDRDRHHDPHHHHHHHNPHHRGGGGGGGPPPDHRGNGRARGPSRGGGGGGSTGGSDGGGRSRPKPAYTITFRSFEEERAWTEERRRKRLARKSKFDVPPTPEQMAADAAVLALANPAATDFAGIPADRNFAAVPQQTRHARRLYIGHLPANVTEEELHVFFRAAVQRALVHPPPDNDDPILSVYINHERRFCFLEFKTVEMATACLALDGIDIHGKGKVKVKRPNDYNPAMAPKVHPSAIPQLDVSKLGIISGTVQDGPNKVFIGGLHYHLTEEQVLELLQAFGKVKAFHLVKNDPDSMTSKGYCFVEYADPAATQVAVIGLNGMDLGGGKVLTARVAGERSGGMGMMPSPAAVAAVAPVLPGVAAVATNHLHQATMAPTNLNYSHTTNGPPNPRPDAVIINGYDVEVLVDAAMGLRPMPTAPMHLDQFGVPMMRGGSVMSPIMALPIPQAPALQHIPQVPLVLPSVGQPPAVAGLALPPGSSALDIANAALDAAFGGAATASVPPPPPPQQQQLSGSKSSTRILVLHNMVMDEDLATEEDYNGLVDEVRGECAKYGKLLGMKVPRSASELIQASAIKKIFLEYATAQDAKNAEDELSGRQFGPNVVRTTYYPEDDYISGRLL